MTTEPTPFATLRRDSARRLVIAALCTAVASGCASTLTANLVPAERWIAMLMLACVAGAVALVLGADTMQRWHQLRQLRPVEDGSKPYGFTGTVPRQTAATELGGKTRH